MTPALPNFKGVEQLQFTQGSSAPNYDVWRAQLIIALTYAFNELAKFIILNEYWIPPPIPSPTAAEEAEDKATGGYARIARTIRIEEREKLIARMESNKSKCFAFIMSTLSAESVIALHDLPTYTTKIAVSYDPLLLIEAIELTHSTAFDRDSTMMELTVKNQYLDLKQYKTESLILFRKRLEAALVRFDALEIARPPDIDVVNHFTKALDQSRYSEAIHALHIKVREGERKYPADVHAMYLFLTGRVPDGAAARPTEPQYQVDSVFAAEEEEINPKKIKKVKAKEPKTCRLCPESVPAEKKLHWMKDCPYLDSFHKYMQAEAVAKKGATHVMFEDEEDGMW